MQVVGEADTRVLALVLELGIAVRVLDADSGDAKIPLRSAEDKAEDGIDSADVAEAVADVAVWTAESVGPIEEAEPSDVCVVFALAVALEIAVGAAVEADAVVRLCSNASVDVDVLSVDLDADRDSSVTVSMTPWDSPAGIELGDEELANGEDRAGTGV